MNPACAKVSLWETLVTPHLRRHLFSRKKEAKKLYGAVRRLDDTDYLKALREKGVSKS